MKQEYDFSGGERGKFYHAEAEFDIPVYLAPHSLYKDPKSLISWGCSESWVEMYFQTMT